MSQRQKSSVRSLYAWEIHEARIIFANRLNYDRVQIHENVAWPDTLKRTGLWLRRIPYDNEPNAITLGYHCFFPTKLSENPVTPDHPDHKLIGWLMHELTHVWQYQQMGWRYLWLALKTQIREGIQAYDFGGEMGLLEFCSQGGRLVNLNLEQQGDVARSYYNRICAGQSPKAWLPLIAEFQSKNPKDCT